MKLTVEDAPGRYERHGRASGADASRLTPGLLLMDSRCLHCGGANTASSVGRSQRPMSPSRSTLQTEWGRCQSYRVRAGTAQQR